VPDNQPPLSPAAGKEARDKTRQALRETKRAVAQALQAAWEDRDSDVSNIIEAALAADADGRMTAWLLLGLASRALTELADATGTSREDHLMTLLR
jgi:DNA-binding phage protein